MQLLIQSSQRDFMLQFVVLAMAAFVTATISGTIGMGGGILLLATMFCFLPHGSFPKPMP